MSSFRSAETALRQAQLTGDVAALDKVLDEDLVFTGPDGLIYGKGDDLDAHRSGSIRITELAPSEEHVQEFGDIVVLSVTMEMRGSFHGEDFAGPFRYTRIWRNTERGWRVVAGHVSAISQTV